MSPVATVCGRHRVIVPEGQRCARCAAEDGGRRGHLNQALGRNSAHWRRLRARLIAQAEGVCPACSEIETYEDPGSKLTVDLIAGGDHSRARLEDCAVRCRRCHGRKDH